MNSLILALLLAPADAATQSSARAIGRASVRIVSAESVSFANAFRLDRGAETEARSKPPLMRHQSVSTKTGEPETRLIEFY